MTSNRTVTCDGCGNEIKGSEALHRNEMLVLTVGLPPLTPSPTQYGLYVHPIMPGGDCHFHGFTCLTKWIESEGWKGTTDDQRTGSGDHGDLGGVR